MSIASKLISIATGWRNLAIMPEIWRLVALQRAYFCAKCAYNKPRWWFFGRPSCTKCGCDIAAKVWSPYEKCPVGNWDSENPSSIAKMYKHSENPSKYV